MCGRARCTVRVDDVGRACGFSAPLRTLDSDRFHPSYNVSPGRYMPVVRHASQAGGASEDFNEPIVHCMKWGLVPSFSKKGQKPDHFRMFNARSESVHLKSSFSRLLPKSRCVTTVEGFYEWKKDGAKKQPYYVHFKDGRPLVFAGLYDSWKDEEGTILYTFTMLTTRSSRALDWLHDRMPVILPNQESINTWLNDDLQEPLLHKLTQPYEDSDLVWYPVTPAMGKPTFDSSECVKEIQPKIASDSKIAQLFGKKQAENELNLGPAVLRDRSSDGHQILEEEVPESLTVEQDEDILTDYDRKSLLAGMEPDQDITHTLQKDQITDVADDVKGHDNELNLHNQGSPGVPVEHALEKCGKEAVDGRKEGRDISLKSLESSPAGQGDKTSPASKRRRLSMSSKGIDKKGEIRLSKDKQKTLLSFFGKE